MFKTQPLFNRLYWLVALFIRYSVFMPVFEIYTTYLINVVNYSLYL